MLSWKKTSMEEKEENADFFFLLLCLGNLQIKKNYWLNVFYLRMSKSRNLNEPSVAEWLVKHLP